MRAEALCVLLVAAAILVRIGFWLAVWFRRAPLTPNPWDPALDAALEDPESLPLCHRCFAPQGHNGWFCPECGTTVGPYVNWLPYVQLFAEGEILRNGLNHTLRRSWLTVVGYLVLSVSDYLVFAPVYWFFLFKNLRRVQEPQPEPPAETVD